MKVSGPSSIKVVNYDLKENSFPITIFAARVGLHN